mmetsp:Transcript_5399/g.11339  ORF Transcript_5399/g.11339 Transcript_5399/m.11339 type:complete len:209 (+) Transcript_5399:68-694(+)
MDDDEMQRLHDTLAMLKPKGRTGGLGRGGVGVVKKADDGLPNNALYSHFVRAGALDLHHKKFDDAEVSNSDEKKERKRKKEARKAEKKEKLEENDSAATEPTNKIKRRKSDEPACTEKSMREIAEEDAVWVETIKVCLKRAEGKCLGIKVLRKAVLSTLSSSQDSVSKKAQKAKFAAALISAGPKVVTDQETDGDAVVRYIKKAKGAA